MPGMDAHRLAEERSLALHRLIAEILRDNPERVALARARVQLWQQDGSVSARYSHEWARLLDGPLEVLLHTLVDESEHARALRQATPFAGLIDPRTRWRIWREVRERVKDSA